MVCHACDFSQILCLIVAVCPTLPVIGSVRIIVSFQHIHSFENIWTTPEGTSCYGEVEII